MTPFGFAGKAEKQAGGSQGLDECIDARVYKVVELNLRSNKISLKNKIKVM